MIPGIINEILAHKTGQLWSVSPDATVSKPSRSWPTRTSARCRVSGDKLLGVVSEREYTRKVALKGKSSKETKVREIIAPPVTATPAHTVEDV